MATATLQDAAEVLGVAPTSSDREIDAAWRALLREVHPDRHPHADAAEQARLAAATRRANEARAALRRSRQTGGWDWNRQGTAHASRAADPAATRRAQAQRATARVIVTEPPPAGGHLGSLVVQLACIPVGLYWTLLLALHLLR